MEKRTLKEDMLLASAGITILAVCLWDGIGITFDSYLYLFGGAYLLEHGLENIFAVPAFRAKPPVLAVLYALLQNSIPLIKASNILLLAGTLLINFRLVNILISRAFFRRMVKALLATATPFMLVHSFLWSEPFFIFILSLYYLYSYRALTRRQTIAALYLLPVLGVLLIGLRHIGIVFTLASSLYLLLNYKSFDKKQLVPLMLNLVLPVVALFVWHLGVQLHEATTEGYDLTNSLDIWRNFLVYADVLKVWMIPPGLPLPELLSVVAAIVYIVVAVVAVQQSYSSDKRHLVLLFVASGAAYAGLMLLKGDLLVDDRERYYSVIYAPLFMLLFYVLSNQSGQTTINRKVIYLLIFLWFGYPLARTLHNVNRWRQDGINTYNPTIIPENLQPYQNPEL